MSKYLAEVIRLMAVHSDNFPIIQAESIADFMRTMKQAPVKRENKTKPNGIKIRIG